MLEYYFQQYPTEDFEVIDVELPLEYKFPSGDVFTGRIDLKIRKGGKYYIVDHKTTGWSMASLARSLGVSDQANGYILINNAAFPDQPIEGVVFNILRNVKSVYNYGRFLVIKSKKDVTRFMLDTEYMLSEIAQKLQDEKARWVRNTYNCFSFGRECPFLKLCQGANYEGLIGITYKIKEAKND